MSAIVELKYNMVEMITQLEDDSSVEELYQIILEFLREKNSVTDLWDELTPAQREELDIAIAETEDESKWVPHEAVLKKFEQWAEN
ncbi:MAG: hypothetical protein ACKVUS_12315 [Saprospiraceae bacterium]